MSRVLRRDEITTECRWQPQAVEAPETADGGIDPDTTAHAIRREAEADAAALRAQAEEARAAAHAEGYRSGQAQAEREHAEGLAALLRVVEEVNREREAFFAQCEPELVRLAVAIAEKVLAQQLALKPEMIIEHARTHITRIRDREMLTIRAHPDDIPLLGQARQTFMGEIDGIHEIQLLEDRRVGRGGIIIESTGGTFDARLSTQLAVIREALVEPNEETDDAEVL